METNSGAVTNLAEVTSISSIPPIGPSEETVRVASKANPVNAILIAREISIDAGHRVTNHGSKCRNVHGHRYKIEAALGGELHDTGEQEGMILDFGFLKDIMMEYIDKYFDHGMILWRADDLVLSTLSQEEILSVDNQIAIKKFGFLPKSRFWGKICVIPVVPTAENLAKLWFDIMEESVSMDSDGKAFLNYVKVYETPNCAAIYIK